MIKYSIIIPTYRGANKLSVVLDSLTRQSIRRDHFEIIIIDDCSPKDHAVRMDRLVEKYPELNIHLLHLPINLGPAVARNEGIKIAGGNIIFFTDDDCEVPALWMESHVSIYRNNLEISAVGGWYRTPMAILQKNIYEILIAFRYETTLNLYQPRRSQTVPQPNYSNFPATNTANFSVKAHVLKTVQFDERFKAAGVEDTEFCIRIVRSGFNVYYLPQFVLHHKTLSFRSFLRLAKSRGLGTYVKNAIDLRIQWDFATYHTMASKYISLQCERLGFSGYRKIQLRALNFIFCFVITSWLYKILYARQYSRHQKNLYKWNTRLTL